MKKKNTADISENTNLHSLFDCAFSPDTLIMQLKSDHLDSLFEKS